jgi:sulfate permease, SulP family
MRGYRRGWLRIDVLAGLAAGTVVIPQAMAYATIAGLPVQVGLYTCLVPTALYALLGGARALSVSTTSTIAVLVASAIASLPDGAVDSTSDQIGAAATLTFMVGVCLLGMRLLRLGTLVEMVSPATLSGIRVGVGLTVAASQLPALLGVAGDPDDDGFFGRLADVVGKLDDVSAATVALSAVSITVLLVLRHLAPRVPGPLVVVAGGIVLVASTSIEDHGVALIDRVPRGLPSLQLPVGGDVLELLPAALAIAVMAFLETVLVARTNRRRDEPPIVVDQELVAVGIAALGGGLTQTLPPAGGLSQSAVNLRSGARTQVAQLATVVLAVLVAVLLAPLLDDLPRAVLAAMVIVAITGLLDPRDFADYARIDRAELWIAVIVTALGLTGGMLLGVAVGLVLTLVLVVRQVNRPRLRPLYRRPAGGWTTNPPADDPGALASVEAGVLVLHLDSGLYAGNAQPTVDALLATVRDAVPPVSAIVVEAATVREVTVPFLDALRTMSTELGRGDVMLVLAALPGQSHDVLRRSHWFREFEAAGGVWPTVDAALTALASAPGHEAGSAPER